MEGTICTPGVNPNCTPPPGHIPPVFQYSSASPSLRCSITGGYVYRGTRGTLPNGSYIYGDYCTGEILLWNNNQQIPLLDIAELNLASFGEDEDGELYVCFLSSGLVQKVVAPEANANFDGDFRTDVSVFRPSTGVWYILNSFDNSFRAQQFGFGTDIPAPADYDGDNKTDLGVFRRTANANDPGFWYYLRSSDNTFRGIQWGRAIDQPLAGGDYDGDGKDDLSIISTLNNAYYILNSGDGSFTVRSLGSGLPVPGDYDGDGKFDAANFYSQGAGNGVWRVYASSNNSVSDVQFGISNDKPVPGDYDGDGRTDRAVFRPDTGVWYIQRSSNNSVQAVTFGASSDVPVVGDYDGDGRDDIAVFRLQTGAWYYIRSSDGAFAGVLFGQGGTNFDLPIPAYDAP